MNWIWWKCFWFLLYYKIKKVQDKKLCKISDTNCVAVKDNWTHQVLCVCVCVCPLKVHFMHGVYLCMCVKNLPQILTHLLLLMYQIIVARICIICQTIERCRIGVGLRWQRHMIWRYGWWTQRNGFACLLQKFRIHFENNRLII